MARKDGRPVAIREMDELLDLLGRRPRAIEALLIGPDNVVRGSNRLQAPVHVEHSLALGL
jgi:hypothetical protein